MKIRSLLAAGFSLMMAQVVFAGSSNCVEGTPVPNGSVVNTAFSCTFYEENVYPFSLTNYMTDFGLYTTPADLANNYVTPGYLVVTTDPGNLSDKASWTEVLDFVGDQLPDAGAPQGFDGSDKVVLYYGASLAGLSAAAVAGDGLAWTVGNPYMVVDQSYTIQGLPPTTSATPEPSTLLLVFPAALGVLAYRRRRA